jgi:hypothetical protein
MNFEFYRKEQLDVSLYHINPICVPSDVCANEDLAVIGQDFMNGNCAEDECYIVLTCTASSKPIVVTDHLGGMVSHASSFFFSWDHNCWHFWRGVGLCLCTAQVCIPVPKAAGYVLGIR